MWLKVSNRKFQWMPNKTSTNFKLSKHFVVIFGYSFVSSAILIFHSWYFMFVFTLFFFLAKCTYFCNVKIVTILQLRRIVSCNRFKWWQQTIFKFKYELKKYVETLYSAATSWFKESTRRCRRYQWSGQFKPAESRKNQLNLCDFIRKMHLQCDLSTRCGVECS